MSRRSSVYKNANLRASCEERQKQRTDISSCTYQQKPHNKIATLSYEGGFKMLSFEGVSEYILI